MAKSQNARFSGAVALDTEFDSPPGASIARLLRDALAKRGWDVSDIDNWRDVGWSISCCRLPLKLELVVAKMAEDEEWGLQIAPSYVPGLVGAFMKKRPSAGPDAIQALAEDAFSVLVENGSFSHFMWRWDGFPEPGNSTPDPVPAMGSSEMRCT